MGRWISGTPCQTCTRRARHTAATGTDGRGCPPVQNKSIHQYSSGQNLQIDASKSVSISLAIRPPAVLAQRICPAVPADRGLLQVHAEGQHDRLEHGVHEHRLRELAAVACGATPISACPRADISRALESSKTRVEHHHRATKTAQPLSAP